MILITRQMLKILTDINRCYMSATFIKGIIIMAALVLVGAGCVGGGLQESGYQSSTEKSGVLPNLGQAPEFALADYNGRTIRLSDFAGKPMVINSWAAWCPFCKKELVDFATVQKEYGDEVVIIAIDRGESLTVAQKYSDELGVTDDLVFLLDPSDSFYQSIGAFSMPETIFVDQAGNIRDHKRGPMEIDEIRQRMQRLLAQE